MIKRNLMLCAVFFLSGGIAYSEENQVNASTGSAIAAPSFLWRKVENKAFTKGESFKYSIHWGPFTAGWAQMAIPEIDTVNGRKAYHIVTLSRSHPFFDSFYKVDNKDESWIDIESLCSLKYEKHQSEGKYRKEEYMSFDHENKKVRMREKYMDQNYVDKENAVTEFIQDILSGLYFIRTKNLKVGADYIFDVQAGDKVYTMRVIVLRKESIRVPAGKFNCYVVEPTISGNVGIFVAKGQLWVWLTDDEKKVPVYMKSKIFIGSVWADLESMKF